MLSASQQNHPEALHFLATQFYPLGDKAMCDWHELTKEEYEKQAIKFLSQACDLGFAKSMPYLAEYYLCGFGGIEKDEKKAVELFGLAEKKGVPQAEAWLAKCYQMGKHGLEKDPEKAFIDFRRAHNQGERFANDIFNSNYELGHELFKNCKYLEALKFLQQAAKEKYPAAYLLLGWLYAKSGRVGPANQTLSKQWYEEAGKYFSWFKAQAETKDAQAVCNLGHCYYYGYGTPKDAEEALKFYRRSNTTDADLHAGHCHRCGHGVSRNQKYNIDHSGVSVELYKSAAEKGNVEAMVIMGKFYRGYILGPYRGNLFGKGFNSRYLIIEKATAVSYFRDATAKGYAEGQYQLGLCYKRGLGVAKDTNLANKYFKMAADQGHWKAKGEMTACSIM